MEMAIYRLSCVLNVSLTAMLLLRFLKDRKPINALAFAGQLAMLLETPFLMHLYHTYGTNSVQYGSAYCSLAVFEAVFIMPIMLSIDTSRLLGSLAWWGILIELIIRVDIEMRKDFALRHDVPLLESNIRSLIDMTWTLLLCLGIYSEHAATPLRRIACQTKERLESLQTETGSQPPASMVTALSRLRM